MGERVVKEFQQPQNVTTNRQQVTQASRIIAKDLRKTLFYILFQLQSKPFLSLKSCQSQPRDTREEQRVNISELEHI